MKFVSIYNKSYLWVSQTRSFMFLLSINRPMFPFPYKLDYLCVKFDLPRWRPDLGVKVDRVLVSIRMCNHCLVTD